MKPETPAVILVEPKFERNIAAVKRACAAFGIKSLWIMGDVDEEFSPKGKRRRPRELRMLEYDDVDIWYGTKPFDAFAGARIIGVEVIDSAIPLPWQPHQANDVYVFGPEDGSLPASVRRHCHAFTIIPSDVCLNLAAAVSVVLYDRRMKTG